MNLNKREVALILAGLRLLQRDLDHEAVLPDAIEDILDSANAREAPLERIDRLCEKINLGDVVG